MNLYTLQGYGDNTHHPEANPFWVIDAVQNYTILFHILNKNTIYKLADQYTQFTVVVKFMKSTTFLSAPDASVTLIHRVKPRFTICTQ